jgi:hypothetical protein
MNRRDTVRQEVENYPGNNVRKCLVIEKFIFRSKKPSECPAQ